MRILALSLVSRALHIASASIAGVLFTMMLTQAANAVIISLYTQVTNCPNQSLCDEPIVIVPSNRAMTVTNVSCSILHGSQNVEILQAQLKITNISGTVLVRDAVVPTLTGKGPLGSYFAFNTQTLLALSPGHRLFISVATDVISSYYIDCKIAGDWRIV